jgi:hypothetical protein
VPRSSIAVPGIVTLGSKDTPLGGEVFHQTRYAGWVVQYQLTDTLSTGLNFGGVYDLNKTYHFLFSFGRAVENVSASSLFSFYMALRLTY